ncbi:TIGR02301 family protein [Pseudochelatococcus sp. B33]
MSPPLSPIVPRPADARVRCTRRSHLAGRAVRLRLVPPLAALLWSVAVAAQPIPLPPAREQPSAGSGPDAGTPGRTPPPGYERELLRLSEVMGSLAFLRTLCGAGDAAQWRKRMAALMDSEARDAETRARIAGAFNQGYRAFAVTYRTCTPAAEVAIARYLAEGERLTRAIAARFGD